MSSVLSLDNPVFRDFAFYGTLCIGKLMLSGPLTTWARAKVIGAVAMFYQDSSQAYRDLAAADVEVERVRRMHRNDLENIPPFLFAGLLYVLTEPEPEQALWYFRIFTCARLLITPSRGQPGRFICCIVGAGCTGCLMYEVLMAVLIYP